jgi:crotonobetainyl-CoA hydratase
MAGWCHDWSESVSGPAALYEVVERVGVITLNRPESMNAVNGALSTAVGEALDAAAADPQVRAIVVTGAGRAFCAGADLKAIAIGGSIFADEHPEWGFAGFVQHWVDKPTIAAVNGFAMGGGTELALACDLVVASSEATFGLPEVRRGLIAAAGGVIRLQRQIPAKRALELALTGQPIDAETAAEWGLVNRVVSPDQVVSAALELAGVIAANAPTAVRQTKRVIHQTAGRDWDESWGASDPWQISNDALMEALRSPDAFEGPRAFAEKRNPVWSDL